MSTWHTQHIQKTAAKQAIRMRTNISSHGTRCWSRLRWKRCAGWLCRATRRTVGICPWNVQQGSDCRDAQTEWCESTSTCLQAWKTGERLLHAQPPCVYSTIRNGSMEWECGKNVAVRQELRRLCQCWTKIGLGPSAPRTGPQFCLSFALD